jgi:ATP-dependent DNA helicase DinG
MLTDELKKRIQRGYSTFIEKKSYRSRIGQRSMVAEVARYLGSIEENEEGVRTSPPKLCVVEAGTGTGKTLAYTVAAIPFALENGKKLIISTATTALQDQIVFKDLPDFAENSGEKFTFALAKGRGRYLCMSKLENQLHGHQQDQTGTLPLFLMEDTVAAKEDSDILEGMKQQYASMSWNGDKDQWPDPIAPELWSKVSTDNHQCTKRHCSFFQNCSYYLARKKLDDADVIVANHDLVLSDLSLGGGVVLTPPEETIYIFDEAHHLADKALSHFAVQGALKAEQKSLKQMTKILADFLPEIAPGNALRTSIDTLSQLAKSAHIALETCFEQLEQTINWSESHENRGQITQLYRYPNGVVDEDLRQNAAEIKSVFDSIRRFIDEINQELERALDEKPNSVMDKESAESWSPVISLLLARTEATQGLWQFFATEDKENAPPSVRWLTRHLYGDQVDIQLSGSPLLAGGLLHHRLWSQCFGAVLTSATLSSLGTFTRLQQSTGIPEYSIFNSFSSPFNYQNAGLLVVPRMNSRPSDADDHTAELISLIPAFLNDDLGTLVLFSSRRQMNQVREGVDKALQDLIITQDDMSKQEIIKQHRARIDDQQPSIIFGLASFAEGIDLPGKYLTSVMIAKIPFSVPNDPLTEALSEWIEMQGGKPFFQISVPDASFKLIQACGRLLRTEEDYGRITVFDNRLIYQSYGRLLLQALPPFRQQLG